MTDDDSNSDSNSHSRRVAALLAHISPKTTVTATLFSRAAERVFHSTQPLPDANLIDLPKGDPPSLSRIFPDFHASSGQPSAVFSGHLCVVGPTGSGKSTIIRHILLELTRSGQPLQIYTLEAPVEVALETHGIQGANQIDLFAKPNGRDRQLESMATELLKHDPDLIYFGELRTKRDFETATQIALSGVGVVSTGHASSPLDLLERLRAMNIDLATQFRALKCILGVKRVPLLCPDCRQQVLVRDGMYPLYRAVALSKAVRNRLPPIAYVVGSPQDIKRCGKCTGGHRGVHTMYEYLHITPEDTLESLRARHVAGHQEELLSLVLEGRVSVLYLEDR